MPKSLELLLEYRQEGRKTWAIRFYRDGLVKEYSDSTMTFENDKIVTHALAPAWRKLTLLSPAELAKLIESLRQADLFSLPEQVGDPKGVMDATWFTWEINLDGRQKKVRAVGPQASSNPILKSLSELVQKVTADAFDRQAGKE
jgi:hypothetical protein